MSATRVPPHNRTLEAQAGVPNRSDARRLRQNPLGYKAEWFVRGSTCRTTCGGMTEGTTRCLTRSATHAPRRLRESDSHRCPPRRRRSHARARRDVLPLRTGERFEHDCGDVGTDTPHLCPRPSLELATLAGRESELHVAAHPRASRSSRDAHALALPPVLDHEACDVGAGVAQLGGGASSKLAELGARDLAGPRAGAVFLTGGSSPHSTRFCVR